jgi:hypothetical protein
MMLRASVLVLFSCILLRAPVSPAELPEDPQDDQLLVIPVIPRYDLIQAPAKPNWGDDTKICDGLVHLYGKGQTASASDTAGGIYVAVNEQFQDTLSRIVVYRSTDGGLTWGQIGGFRSVAFPIQSFDMCISDTSSGEWLLGFAFIIKTDESPIGGGQLMWGSMLGNGLHGRIETIGKIDGSTCFRNPSICTDGEWFPVKDTHFFVAAELVTPSNDRGRGVYVNHSSNWGDTWPTPDTSIIASLVQFPIIGVDWTTNPDSLCIAFAGDAGGGHRDIYVARNTIQFTTPWSVTQIEDAYDKFYPSMAIDQVNGNVMVTYTRTTTGSPTKYDAMYVYSRDQFRTYVRDSIATSTTFEDLTSVSWSHIGSTYNWRVTYHSEGSSDTVFFKSILNTPSGFYVAKPVVINQFEPAGNFEAVVGFDRDVRGTTYRGNCIYVGHGAKAVYFDAVDLTLDVEDRQGLPSTCALFQNYPNPFNPSTTIRYGLPNRSHVSLTVFNTLGQQIALLQNGEQEAGYHEVKFDASGLSSGVYLCRLTAGTFVQTQKMVVVR